MKGRKGERKKGRESERNERGWEFILTLNRIEWRDGEGESGTR